MNKKHLALAMPVLILGLLSLSAVNWGSVSSEESARAGNSAAALAARVGKLEEQVASLQEQTKDLASKPVPKILAVSGTQSFPGNNIPPGATEREINGMKYWLIPLK